MIKGYLLENEFLEKLKEKQTPVAVYLVNGIKLQGHVESFDEQIILLKNSVTQMVYKHAVSTIVPGHYQPERPY